MEHARPNWFDRLRKIAESVDRDNSPERHALAAKDVDALLNEIQIYQTELEIQNDELRRTQDELQCSRDRLSILFNQSPSGYLVLDDAGIILDANHTISIMLETQRGALLKKPFSRFVAPDDRPFFWGSFKALYGNPARKAIHLRLLRGANTVFHARLEGRSLSFPSLSDVPEDDQFCLVVMDVDDTQKAEIALKRSEERLKYILDSMSDMVLEVDANLTVLWANRSTLDLNPDAVGQTCHEAFPGRTTPCQGCPCLKAMTSGKIETNIMHQPQSKTAGKSYWENVVIPLNADPERAPTYLIVSRNVTERVTAEVEREHLLGELTAALQQVKTLKGLLPICCHCKKIRDDDGYWTRIEAYIHKHSDVELSHGICPECAKKHYPDLGLYDE